MNRLPRLLPLLALPLTAGCDMVVLNPAGDVARQQANLILWSTGLMLLIIVPVMALTVLFAWRYRAKNQQADYRPDWDHSTILELAIWSAPLLIVIALGALTWVSTHTLDPYRPLGRIAAGRPVPAGQKPLEVQVVSLDWKWLFIYPEQGIATVNELVVPVDRQVRFRLTSSSVMNTFYVPAMAGMIYTMPGMETKLHAVLNRPGTFEGVSANYSGAGFSDMRFPTLAVDPTGFDRWAAMVKGGGRRLGQAEYLALEKPSERVPTIRFGAIDPALFGRIVQMCVRPGQRCMSGDMHTKGAMEKAPEDLGTSPHMSAPHGDASGKGEPGDDSNRNMTRLDTRALPGARPTGRG
ncbi:cytochrome O ubiquinol oxidase [Sphingomonas sp. Leaf412]|uniref:ubiquinol oxidase subunit II n=1 Tax=Sphingomonas sp. Leaf412 TaxID=1736370 RepID=UPI0006F2AEE6|nr:ubiquinol oxidase subunit II [Sphingomonas sp. Leaf412]KQT31303.1 cytochrome O ubiquinol oxidase [Sphingomonas sp. Leaf412]